MSTKSDFLKLLSGPATINVASCSINETRQKQVKGVFYTASIG
jgi:hypothetical protein